MHNYLIIGAGQLGSRHLQALALCSRPVQITVVDPSQASLEMARSRFGEMPANPHIHAIHYCTSIKEVSLPVDFCVIATNANYRLAALSSLLSQVPVKHLLLEKVLFQSSAQIEAATRLLQQYATNTWVNCPRRLFPVYQSLHQLLASDTTLAMTVKGSHWGMACNAVHFIDLWGYLSGTQSYQVDTSQLDSLIVDSKRPGFKEVTGTLTGQLGSKGFSLQCDNNNSKPTSVCIHITTENHSITIDEIGKTCVIKDLRTGKEHNEEFATLPQSQLTHKVAASLLDTGECGLTPYSESAALHQPFLQELLAFFNKHGNTAYSECPIT